MNETPIGVTVWGENIHEYAKPEVGRLYPHGMQEAIAEGLRTQLGDRVNVRTATLQQPEHGLTEQMLADTDVLSWWGHGAHDQVDDVVVDRVYKHVLAGMGLLVLHSAHFAKIFKRLMGTSCSLRWRESDDRELVWTVNLGHPITAGVPEVFAVPKQEMYGEYFDIPQPDELVFVSSFSGGEVFRSGCCFTRGIGRVFYFSPGHETYPVYHQAEIKQILANAVCWSHAGDRRRSQRYDVSNAPVGWIEEFTKGS